MSIEVLWNVIAAVGLAVSSMSISWSVITARIPLNKSNGRRTVALGTLRREVVRAGQQAIHLTIGVYILLDPSTVSWTSFVAWAFVVDATLVLLNTYLDNRMLYHLLVKEGNRTDGISG